MRMLIILFLLLIALFTATVIVGAILVFCEEEDIRETVYGEVWKDER